MLSNLGRWLFLSLLATIAWTVLMGLEEGEVASQDLKRQQLSVQTARDVTSTILAWPTSALPTENHPMTCKGQCFSRPGALVETHCG
jgi:hypothetical protein